jgi:hypothetical protein
VLLLLTMTMMLLAQVVTEEKAEDAIPMLATTWEHPIEKKDKK